MVIKRVYIEQFGKITKKEFFFDSGINIIYGKNESGKTTLEQFLLTMFYGGRTSKKFGIDARVKYIPFGQDFAFGQMVMEIDGKTFLFERKLGQKKKDDVFRNFDEKTFDQASFDEHLGKHLFDLDLEPFLKTLFVSQSALRFPGEKDESLNTKLTNLLETGDEDVSYTKAMDILDGEMKKIKGTRKTGILDELYVRLNQRYKALDDAKRDQEEKDLIEKKIEEISTARQTILDSLEDLSNLKEKIHLYEVQDQMAMIQDSIDQIDQIKNQKDENCSSMTEEDLELLNEQIQDLERQEEEIHILENDLHGEKRLLELVDLDLENYLGFSELSSDSALTLVKNQGDVNLILEKLKRFNQEKNLNPKLLEKREELTKLLHGYEKYLKKLKPRKKEKLILFFGIFTGVFLVQALILKSLNYSLLTLGIGILVFIGGTKLSKTFKTNNLKKVESFEEKIHLLSHDLEMNPMEVIKSKRIIDYLPKENEKEKLVQELERLKKYSEAIYNKTNTKNLEEFMEKQTKYYELKMTKNETQLQLEKIENELARNLKALGVSQELVLKRIRVYGPCKDTSDAKALVEVLTLRKARESSLLAQEESLNYTLKSLIGDRTIEEVKEEVKTLKKLGLLDENNQQSLEEKQRMWQEEESNLAELLSELSHKNLKFTAEDPIQIEDEISTLLEEEEQLKRRYLVLETTRELMESSYRDLRGKYISVLNENVSRIFNRITNTQRDVKVAEHFSMKYEEDRKICIDSSLSKGALDQLYFALRFAMINLIFKEERIPVFLDEPFVSYDEDRLKSTLDYLHQVENHRQIFIFTCHEREVNLLQKYGHVVKLS